MGKYLYVAMPIEEVMANIDEYIIPENKEIIEYLWDMNILTTQTNNYENEFSWIQLGELSEENEKIFWKLVNEMMDLDERTASKFTTYRGISVPIVPGTRGTFDDFKLLVDHFKPQDVQKDGYMTEDEFFIKMGFSMVIDNPEYGKVPEPEYEDYNDVKKYQEACKKYNDSLIRRITVVDRTKITKPIEEYLEERGYSGCYDKEEGKIFYNKRLYEGHMRFKNKEQAKKHL